MDPTLRNYEKHPRYAEWFSTARPAMICPYCGDIKAWGHDKAEKVSPAMICCDEMHVQPSYVDAITGEVLLYDTDFYETFTKWLEEQ